MKQPDQNKSLDNFSDREFKFTDSDFRNIKSIVESKAGIILNEQKKAMIYGRLAPRIRKLKLKDFKEYCLLLTDPSVNELEELIDIITTNVTKFFREDHHFEFLGKYAKELVKRKQLDKTLYIWSAGCSTGEEPYTIAMTLQESLPEGWGYNILATDLCTTALSHAKTGVYDLAQAKDIEPGMLQKYFQRGKGNLDGKIRVRPSLHQNITFEKLNLMNEVNFSHRFDIVFCRNVIIYFDKEFKLQLLKQYHQALKPDGYLIIGHSESIYGMEDKFGRTEYKTVFKRIGDFHART